MKTLEKLYPERLDKIKEIIKPMKGSNHKEIYKILGRLELSEHPIPELSKMNQRGEHEHNTRTTYTDMEDMTRYVNQAIETQDNS